MSTSSVNDDVLIEKLHTHLQAEGYSPWIQRWYPACVRTANCWITVRANRCQLSLFARFTSLSSYANNIGGFRNDTVSRRRFKGGAIDTRGLSIPSYDWSMDHGQLWTHRAPRFRPFTVTLCMTTTGGSEIFADFAR